MNIMPNAYAAECGDAYWEQPRNEAGDEVLTAWEQPRNQAGDVVLTTQDPGTTAWGRGWG